MNFIKFQSALSACIYYGVWAMLLWLSFSTTQVYSQARAVDASGTRLSVEQCLEQSEEQEKLKNYRQASWFLNQAALVRWEEKAYNEAIDYFERSIKLNEKVDNEHGIVGIYSNLAMIYADKEDHKTSVEYFKKTLEGRRSQGSDKVSIISALINTSVAMNNLGQYSESATHLEEALSLARELNDAQQMRSCYGMLSETYEKAGNTEKSIYYFNLYRTFHEMVQRDKEQVYKEREADAQMRAQLAEAEKKAQEIELNYKQQELERKKAELAEANKVLSQFDSTSKQLYNSLNRVELLYELLERSKKQKEVQEENHELEIKQQRIIQYALIAGVIGVIVFSGFLYRSYREKKRANHELSEKNQEILAQREQIGAQKESLEVAFTEIVDKNKRITQSINYAQRIQTAMMPSEEELFVFAPNSFLLFQPRDVVSGDFYWCRTRGSQTAIAVADCTGHGVPGAMVSMLGMSQLEQLVEKNESMDPGELLTGLHKGFHSSLVQGKRQANDGMDIAMVVVDTDREMLLFAGAKNPLAYIDKENVLQVISGDRMPIGGQLRKKESERVFTTIEVPLSEVNRFYLYSDGYQDQFGGEDGRKFMSKNFKALLEEIYTLPVQEQKQKLASTFNEWKGDREQIDDVTVIGVSFNS